MKKITLFLCYALVLFIFSGCPGLTDPPSAEKSEVSDLSTTYSDGAVLLFYTEPEDSDFVSTELTFSPEKAGISQPIPVAKGEGLISDTVSLTGVTGLTNGTEYTFTLKAVYADGGKSEGLTAAVTPLKDVPVPLNFRASAGDGQIILYWEEPEAHNWFSLELTFIPEDADSMQPIGIFPGTTSATVTDLDNGTEYTFTIIA